LLSCHGEGRESKAHLWRILLDLAPKDGAAQDTSWFWLPVEDVTRETLELCHLSDDDYGRSFARVLILYSPFIFFFGRCQSVVHEMWTFASEPLWVEHV